MGCRVILDGVVRPGLEAQQWLSVMLQPYLPNANCGVNRFVTPASCSVQPLSQSLLHLACGMSTVAGPVQVLLSKQS